MRVLSDRAARQDRRLGRNETEITYNRGAMTLTWAAGIAMVAACAPASTPVAGHGVQPAARRSEMKSDVTCQAWMLDGPQFSFYFALGNPTELLRTIRRARIVG
jgi:hypothetical protein